MHAFPPKEKVKRDCNERPKGKQGKSGGSNPSRQIPRVNNPTFLFSFFPPFTARWGTRGNAKKHSTMHRDMGEVRSSGVFKISFSPLSSSPLLQEEGRRGRKKSYGCGERKRFSDLIKTHFFFSQVGKASEAHSEWGSFPSNICSWHAKTAPFKQGKKRDEG